MDDILHNDLVGLTSDIVSAFVSNNPVHAVDLPELIATVHNALSNVGMVKADPEPEKRDPAVPVKKSVTDDFLICLEDGKKFKSLKRHLATTYGMTPGEYRMKWGLPHDYPMVAPSYSRQRTELARSMGLGRKAAEIEATPAPVPANDPAPKARRSAAKRTVAEEAVAKPAVPTLAAAEPAPTAEAAPKRRMRTKKVAE